MAWGWGGVGWGLGWGGCGSGEYNRLCTASVGILSLNTLYKHSGELQRRQAKPPDYLPFFHSTCLVNAHLSCSRRENACLHRARLSAKVSFVSNACVLGKVHYLNVFWLCVSDGVSIFRGACKKALYMLLVTPQRALISHQCFYSVSDKTTTALAEEKSSNTGLNMYS